MNFTVETTSSLLNTKNESETKHLHAENCEKSPCEQTVINTNTIYEADNSRPIPTHTYTMPFFWNVFLFSLQN